MEGKVMASTKQQKVARLLQKELGDIFQKKSKLFENKMITVTVVRISPDLLIAKVYLSIYPSKNNENTLALIREHASEIRYELGNRIRHQVRKIPELNFFIDDSLDYIENIDRLLNEDQHKDDDQHKDNGQDTKNDE
jgi:ribosome-binding factor A